METIVEFLELYYLEIIASVTFLSIISIILVIANSIKTKKIINRYDELMRGVDNKDLEFLLKLYMDNVENVLKDVKKLSQEYKSLSYQIQNCVQKVAIIRYNAFDNVGSNQSYSIALLDNKNNGIVLTGLFGRDASTTYAKLIEGGKSKFPLSEEEKKVIAKAMG